MRMRILLAMVLAAGCGPKDAGSSLPDAEEFIDSPIFTFPDAFRADARPVFDARPPIDAKPGTPDAPVGTPDAPVGTPDAKVGTPDALPPPPPPDAPVAGGLRPWAGPTASVRVLDLQLLGAGEGTKVCLYGTDSDTRPYAVIVADSHSLAGSYSDSPPYDPTVPAGIPLAYYTTDYTGDASPSDCQSGQKQALATLVADEYYTLARTFNIYTNCDSNSTFLPECTYFPRWDTNHPLATCAPADATYLVDDGDALTFGWRVINLSSNASDISVSTAADTSYQQISLDVDAMTGDRSAYQAADGTATQLLICPDYLFWCLAPDALSDNDASSDLSLCTQGNADWIIGQAASTRITDPTLTTTYYVVDNAKELAADSQSMQGLGVTIVITTDNLSN